MGHSANLTPRRRI